MENNTISVAPADTIHPECIDTAVRDARQEETYPLARCHGSERSAVVVPWNPTWDELVEEFTTPAVGIKRGTYFLLGACDGKRNDANMQETVFVILDGDNGFDDLTGEITPGVAPPFKQVCHYLKQFNHSFIGWTTHSNGEPDENGKAKHKWRIVLPIIRRRRKHWLGVQQVIVDQLAEFGVGFEYVSEMKRASQPWFFPRVPEDRQEQFEFDSHKGAALQQHKTHEDLTVHAAGGVKGTSTDNVLSALYDAGLVQEEKPDGKVIITCPWLGDHTGGDDTGTVYFLPSEINNDVGGFKCQHHSCDDRSIHDLMTHLGVTQAGEKLQEAPDEAPHLTTAIDETFPEQLLHPPGVVGKMVDDINRSAYLPQPALAVASALTGFSHVIGGKFLVMPTNTPLGLYTMGVIETGRGKENPQAYLNGSVGELTEGIEEVLVRGKIIEKALPTVVSGFTSGSALVNDLKHGNRLLFTPDEFGRMLELANTHNGGMQYQLVTELMKLFGKASGSRYVPSRYADSKKNTVASIDSPLVNIFATTTRSTLMAALQSSDVDSGFLSRFLMFEGDPRPARCRPEVSRKVTDLSRWNDGCRMQLFSAAVPVAGEDKVKEPKIKSADRDRVTHGGKDFWAINTDEAAESLLEKFANDAHYQVLDGGDLGAIWNRAHQNAVAIAGLLAVGCWDVATEPNPVINAEQAQYAIDMVTWSCKKWVLRLGGELADGLFDAKCLKAMDKIRHAKRYKDDKKEGPWCKLGFMPRNKLQGLMRLTPREFSEVMTHLTTTGDIEEGMKKIGSHERTVVWIPG